MKESCDTCDNGNGAGGCAYPICCIQYSEWKPIPIKFEWKVIDDAARNGEWRLVFFSSELHETQSHFAVSRFNGRDWENDEGEKSLAEADFWMPLPLPPAGSP